MRLTQVQRNDSEFLGPRQRIGLQFGHGQDLSEPWRRSDSHDDYKPLYSVDIDKPVRRHAKTCNNWPGWTRTTNLLIQSQADESVNGVNDPGYDSHGANTSSSPSSSTRIDPDLAAVIDAWPTLPKSIRGVILTMIRATMDQ